MQKKGLEMNNWNGKPYYSFDYMLKERFSGKVYKVALNGGMTCPNRDVLLETGAVSFAAPEDPEILPGINRIPLPRKSKNRLPDFVRNAMLPALLPTFRHIPTPMLLWNISGTFLQKHFLTRMW